MSNDTRFDRYIDYLKDQERLAAYRRLRNERMAEAKRKGTHTPEQWQALQDATGNHCCRCGVPAELLYGKALCKDHALPVALGGSDSISNIQPMCRNCNSSKGADSYQDLIPFQIRRGLGHFDRFKVRIYRFTGWKAVA